MRTPRPTSTRPGVSTFIGFGWLSPHAPAAARLRRFWPRAWDVRGRSALRKCMLLEMPRELREALPEVKVSPALPPVRPKKATTPFTPHRRNPAKDVRIFPAVSPAQIEAVRRLVVEERAKLLAGPTPSAWYEDPIALGSLLLMCPPIGLTVLWTSKRYSTDARWALTIMTALTLCLAASVVIAVFALRAAH